MLALTNEAGFTLILLFMVTIATALYSYGHKANTACVTQIINFILQARYRPKPPS